MTIEEISRLIAQRLLQGCMNHEQFANYYSFLGLEGYKLFHEFHFAEQMHGYRKFISYYIDHYNKLVPQYSSESLTSFSIIPDNWHEHNRDEMDINTRRNAVKSGLEKYVHWEKETKKFLEDMYFQAVQQQEIGIAIKIEQYICSVDQEIKMALKQYLEIKSTDYDLPIIISKQQKLCKKYGKKLYEMRKEFEHKNDKSS